MGYRFINVLMHWIGAIYIPKSKSAALGFRINAVQVSSPYKWRQKTRDIKERKKERKEHLINRMNFPYCTEPDIQKKKVKQIVCNAVVLSCLSPTALGSEKCSAFFII